MVAIIDINNLPKKHNKYSMIKSLVKDDSLSVEFFYNSDYRNTKDLRDFMEIVCDVFKLSLNLKSRIVLISDELNNNAIEYGSNPNGRNIMRIKLMKIDEEIDFNLEVEDNGKGKEHKTALEMETMRAHQLKLGYFNHDSIRGRGLFLITVKIANRLYFRNSKSGGLIVGIKMKVGGIC